MIRWLAFTDLDGTLLDHDTYDWTPAREGVEALRRAGAPLVMASSKTRAEIEVWRERVGNADPFISENGGALFVPKETGVDAPEGAVVRGGYWVVEFGAPYDRLRAALATIGQEARVTLRGFGDMAPAEVADLTGLSDDTLAFSLRREYDEPFVAKPEPTEAQWGELAAAAHRLGLTLTRGGRFAHLTGPNSKGLAARRLADYCARGDVRPETLAAGDGGNDLELLQAVDHPIVVARPDGSHASALREGVPDAYRTRAIGPAGFSEGVLAVLERRDRVAKAPQG